MLIYNTHRSGKTDSLANGGGNGKNGVKKGNSKAKNGKNKAKNGKNGVKKNVYKSRSKRSSGVIRPKVFGGDRSKKSNQKKKLTKKNKNFLERIGLKLK